MDQRLVDELTEEFTFSKEQLYDIAADFRADMRAGLAGTASSLKMLPAFLTLPTGLEQGRYIAIDFGGSNVRIMAVELQGEGRFEIAAVRKALLTDAAGKNLISADATADQMFDFIAEELGRLDLADGPWFLGHTFSFPCQQSGVNRAKLIHWTKEIQTAGVEGRDVTTLLTEALERKGINNILPVAVLNDTVGTLLAGAYSDPEARIGSICGTGHNNCYLEPNYRGAGAMILNMESGGFSGIHGNQYDMQLDAASEKPGSQLMEKMVAGRYLGELFRIVISGLREKGLIGSPLAECFAQPYQISTADLTAFLAERTIAATFMKPGGRHAEEDEGVMRLVAELIVKRSAALVASSFLGILGHIDPQGKSAPTIAIDGSLYEKIPGYTERVGSLLHELLGVKQKVKLQLSKDGSGIGAAIAAAVAAKSAG